MFCGTQITHRPLLKYTDLYFLNSSSISPDVSFSEIGGNMETLSGRPILRATPIQAVSNIDFITKPCGEMPIILRERMIDVGIATEKALIADRLIEVSMTALLAQTLEIPSLLVSSSSSHTSMPFSISAYRIHIVLQKLAAAPADPPTKAFSKRSLVPVERFVTPAVKNLRVKATLTLELIAAQYPLKRS